MKVSEDVFPVVKGETFVLYDRNGRNAKVIGKGSVGSVEEFHLMDRVAEFRSHDLDTLEDQKFEYKKFFKF